MNHSTNESRIGVAKKYSDKFKDIPIKFRAWDIKKSVMLYNIQNAYDMLSTSNISDAKGDLLSYEEVCFGDFLRNKRYIVMQYTGKKDKKEKEIYKLDFCKYIWEGDMHERGGEKIFLVEQEKYIGYLSFICLAAKNSYQLEVVGNLLETPDLMKEVVKLF